MRLLTWATAACACLAFLPLGFGLFASPGTGQAAGTASPVAQTPKPGSADPAVPDAAAKHAKRTACIKEARTKKLLGADKNAFIKECVATP